MNTSSQNTPFTVKINGNQSVLVLKEKLLLIDFAKLQKFFDITYDSIRCIQFWKNTLLINVEKYNKLVGYVIVSSHAKMIHKALLEKT